MSQQLQYALAIANNKCSFVAFINGFPVFINTQGLAYNLSVPINPFIKEGSNDVKIIIQPLNDESNLLPNSELKAETLVKALTELPSQMKSIFTLEMPQGTSTESLPLPGFMLEAPFKLSWNIDYEWTKSPIIKDEINHSAQLVLDAYKSIHMALSRRDINFISNLIREREQEMSKAFYDDFDKGMEDSLKLINDTMHNHNFELQPLNFSNYIVDYAADGRVIYMHDAKYDQPIYFINKQEGIRRELPFYFIFQDSNLVICR